MKNPNSFSNRQYSFWRMLLCVVLLICCVTMLSFAAYASEEETDEENTSETTPENKVVGSCPSCYGDLIEVICTSYVCSKCNKTLVDKHSYTETITPATCTTNGTCTSTCACGHTFTTKIPAPGHNYANTGELDACQTCSRCGEKITYHKADYRNVDGECQNYCKICEYVFFTTTHITETKTTAPTCSTDGATITTCQVCKKEISRTNIQKALGYCIAEEDDGKKETSQRCIYCGKIVVDAIYTSNNLNDFAFNMYKIIAAISISLAIISLASCGWKFLGAIFFGNYASMAGNDMMKAQKQFVFTILAIMFIILLPKIFAAAIAFFKISAWKPS